MYIFCLINNTNGKCSGLIQNSEGESWVYSKTWLQRPPRIATTCFKWPLFRARTVSYRNCSVNSDHLHCATSDRVFRAPPACFPCLERPCDDPKPPFCEVPQQKSDGKPKSAWAEKPTLTISRFWTFLWSLWFFFFLVTSFIQSFALLQCVEPANRDHRSTKTAFVSTKGWSLCTGFTVRRSSQLGSSNGSATLSQNVDANHKLSNSSAKPNVKLSSKIELHFEHVWRKFRLCTLKCFSCLIEIPHLRCDAFREANQTPAGKRAN